MKWLVNLNLRHFSSINLNAHNMYGRTQLTISEELVKIHVGLLVFWRGWLMTMLHSFLESWWNLLPQLVNSGPKRSLKRWCCRGALPKLSQGTHLLSADMPLDLEISLSVCLSHILTTWLATIYCRHQNGLIHPIQIDSISFPFQDARRRGKKFSLRVATLTSSFVVKVGARSIKPLAYRECLHD